MTLRFEVSEPQPTCDAPSSNRAGAMRCELPPRHQFWASNAWPFHHGRDRAGRWRSWPLETGDPR